MKSTMVVEAPGEIEFTLSLTMPLKTWMHLREQLPRDGSWPSSDLRYAINDMVRQAQEKFYPAPQEAAQ